MDNYDHYDNEDGRDNSNHQKRSTSAELVKAQEALKVALEKVAGFEQMQASSKDVDQT